MHAVIIHHLEEYLSGRLAPPSLDRFQTHLDTCSHCRRELNEIQHASSLLAALKARETVDPPASFVVRVIEDVGGRSAPSLWTLFGDFAFGRRVVFASLITMAVLGTVLVSREEAYQPAPPTPQAVMAADTGSPDADQMLVTLANYEP